MGVSHICKQYFNGFNQIVHWKESNRTVNALALLTILSYFTGVIPLGFALAYGASSLCGRACKKQMRSESDSRVDRQRENTLSSDKPEIPTPTPEENRRLANKIIRQAIDTRRSVNDISFIRDVVHSEEFASNPITCLVTKLIQRGVNYANLSDMTMAFIVAHTTNCISTIANIEWLKAFAETFYKGHREKSRVASVIAASFEMPLFQNTLKEATDRFEEAVCVNNSNLLHQAEHDLRIALNVFNQAGGEYRTFYLPTIAE
jgi:hypothetical protein